MFDIGWAELLIIAIVALIVVGPKDLPGMFRTVGQFMGRARGMAREFQRSMEQAADESGLKGAADDLKSASRHTRSPTQTVRSFAEKTVGDPFAADEKEARAAEGSGTADKGAPPPAEQPTAETSGESREARAAGGGSGTAAGS